ncbi:uncharacterized protein [Rutidosis leptorrhynchoides]|uniref:uncharacterized protein n=1 Tax=Rutidosis leptorrhynchoides TaxID=125765 RepID=UPI003A9A0F36
MLQRQIMFKQLEELQRQKKLQELNNSRQQTDIYQQSLIHNKQAPGAQYGPLINGTPVRDASQMFMFGNTNLIQGFQNGLPFSQAQNQVLHSINLPSQPIDAHSFGRFSQLQGMTCESIGEQLDDTSRSSTSDQFNVPYQETNMFGPGFSQGQTGTDLQEFERGQEQDINPSQDSNTLDPLEQKFLFDTDDDSVGGFGKMFEDTDNVQSFPSIQSGSWSALMQSALDETSSTDTGVQEEWSGLSFQNPDLSNDNHRPSLMETGNNPTLFQNNNFQNASSLNIIPEHLKTSNARSSFPGFQPSHKEASEYEASAQVQRFSPLQVRQGLNEPAGEFESVNVAPNKGKEFNKGCFPSKASEVTTFRSSDSSGLSTNVDRSADLSSMDSNAQTSRHMPERLHKVDKFREYKHGTQSAYIGTAPANKMPKTKTSDAFTSSSNSSTPQSFGLRLAHSTQKPPVNYFDLSQISQHAATSHLVSLKNQDGPRSSLIEGQRVPNLTSGANVWVDIPSEQTLSGTGIYKAPGGSPSTSDVANSRMETVSEAPKESEVANNLLEASRHILNSQSLDYARRAEANVSMLKQYISPLNPAYSDPSIRATLKSEPTSVYENYRSLLLPSAARDDQLVKISSHPPLQDVSHLHKNNSFVQMNLTSTSQDGSVKPVIGINSYSTNQLSSAYLQHIDVANKDLVVSQSKKRKFSTYDLLPWHKEAAQGSSRLQGMSIAELEWTQAANRVPEKLKGETEALGDLRRMVHPKKKIILTTQLMQMLFPPIPAAILSDHATACYNTTTYYAARLAVGDACSLVFHFQKPCDMSDSLSGEDVVSKGTGDQNLLKTVEKLIDRAKKLEDELLRLENGASFVDINIESQDLERFAIINRFAKYHSRALMVAAETGPKFYLQRYVTASQMPRIVPEGHNCLSL